MPNHHGPATARTTNPRRPRGVPIDGPKLRRLRQRGGHTLTTLAEAVGVSFQYLSQLERADGRRIGPVNLRKLSEALQLPEPSVLVHPSARRAWQRDERELRTAA